MRQAGHEAILFERSATLGGVFASSAIYPSLHLTMSNWAMAFSDFPNPERLCYSSADGYLRYLQSYACRFDLERHIRYNSEVCSAALGGDGRWALRIRQLGKRSMLEVGATPSLLRPEPIRHRIRFRRSLLGTMEESCIRLSTTRPFRMKLQRESGVCWS